MPLLESDRLRLRALEPGDAAFVFRVENDTRHWDTSANVSPVSMETVKRFIEAAQQHDLFDGGQFRFVAETREERQPVGLVDLIGWDSFHQRAEVGLYIGENYRNMGYGKEALSLLCDYAFGFLDIHQLYAYIGSGNPASAEVFQSAGFRRAGVLAEWHKKGGIYEDVALWQCLSGWRQAHSSPSGE